MSVQTNTTTWSDMVSGTNADKVTLKDFTDNVSIFNTTVTDKGNTLEVYHYTQEPKTKTKFFRSFRGVVLKRSGDGDVSNDERIEDAYNFFVNGGNNDFLSMVAHSYPYTPEFTVNDFESLGLDSDIKNVAVRLAYEGTVVRLFYADGEWRTYTHKKPANKSSWSGPKFSEIFNSCFWNTVVSEEQKVLITPPKDMNKELSYEDALESGDFEKAWTSFTSNLNEKNCYVFLAINHQENRIVCKGKQQLLHVQTLQPESDGRFMLEVQENLGFDKPLIVDAESVEKLCEYVEQLEPLNNPGVVVFTNDGIIKIVNSDYKMLADLRGNEASLRKRYIELRNQPERCAMFVNLFPEGKELFDSVEEDVPRLAWYLHKLYLYRYVDKNFLELSQAEYELLKQCHDVYKTQGVIVKLQVVEERLNESEPTYLNKMLRNLRCKYFTNLFETLGIVDREATTE